MLKHSAMGVLSFVLLSLAAHAYGQTAPWQDGVVTTLTTPIHPVTTPNKIKLDGGLAPRPIIITPVQDVPKLGGLSPNDLKNFVQVFETVRQEYADPLDDQVIMQAAMRGLLREIDPYGEWLDAARYQSLKSWSGGAVASIGAKLENTEQGFLVIQSDVPALAVGDVITQWNDARTLGKTDSEMAAMLRGTAGSSVRVVFSRGGAKHTLTLVRDKAVPTPLELRVVDGIAIVRLGAFHTSTRADILTALARVDASISAMVLDVRDNPGGVLDSALEVAGLFFDGKVAKISHQNGEPITLYTKGAPRLVDMPLLVWQNKASASAAEVLALGLKTQKRAIIVGENSYGKGSVQSVLPVGSGAVKLTTAHYLGLDDVRIDGVGVAADIAINDEETLIKEAKKIALKVPMVFNYSSDF